MAFILRTAIAFLLLSFNTPFAAGIVSSLARDLAARSNIRNLRAINPALEGMLMRHRAFNDPFLTMEIQRRAQNETNPDEQIATARNLLYNTDYFSPPVSSDSISRIDNLGTFFGAVSSSLNVCSPSSICVAASIEECLTIPKCHLYSPSTRLKFPLLSLLFSSLGPVKSAMAKSLSYSLSGSVLSNGKTPDSIDRLVSLGIPVIGISSSMVGEIITPKALKKLQSSSSIFPDLKQIALTESVFAEFGRDQHHVSVAREISQLGIQFSLPWNFNLNFVFSDFPKFGSEYPLFHDGILFTQENGNYGSATPGELLHSLFGELGYLPLRIFYVSSSILDIERFTRFYDIENIYRRRLDTAPIRVSPFLYTPNFNEETLQLEKDKTIGFQWKEIADLISERA